MNSESRQAHESAGAGQGIDDATRRIKDYAAEQKIAVKLSEEQMKAILGQLTGLDPSRPAEVSFVIEDAAAKRPAVWRIAVCSYWGDTCCA